MFCTLFVFRYQRLLINYDVHVKDPARAYETLVSALDNIKHVSLRFELFDRAMKMFESKRYGKYKNQLNFILNSEVCNICDAPIVEIDGWLTLDTWYTMSLVVLAHAFLLVFCSQRKHSPRRHHPWT
jgi:hypothetical protein